MKQIYGAYGSNLNVKQMKKQCPTAKAAGTTEINNFVLVFKGFGGTAVATLEPLKGSVVPIALWEIQDQDEQYMDRYEGYPDLYRKELVELMMDNQLQKVMIYLMDERYPYGTPSPWYVDVIQEGYRDHGFDERILFDAVEQAKHNVQHLESQETAQHLVE